jgi:hypothetical protein
MVEIGAGHAGTTLLAPPAAGRFYQDAAHRFGCGGKEMIPAIPGLFRPAANEAQVCLMRERGRLKCLADLLLREPLCGGLPQLVVHQRQEALGSVGLALVNGAQDAGDFLHSVKDILRSPVRYTDAPVPRAERDVRRSIYRRVGRRASGRGRTHARNRSAVLSEDLTGRTYAPQMPGIAHVLVTGEVRQRTLS